MDSLDQSARSLQTRVEELLKRIAIEEGVATPDMTNEQILDALEAHQAAMVKPAEKVKEGYVEIFDVYDSRYYEIFVNGIYVMNIGKMHFMQELSKKSRRKEIADEAGVKPKNLRYSLYSLYDGGLKDPTYDANDYTDNYQRCLDDVAKYKIKPIFVQQDLDYLETIRY